MGAWRCAVCARAAHHASPRAARELALQLARDALPALRAASANLVCVGIGTPQRAAEFCANAGFPDDTLYADPDNVCYDALRLRHGWGVTFFSVSTPFAMKERFEKDGAKDLAEFMPRWKPWLPPKMEQSLQQGGAFVFRGREAVLQHYDESTGAHVDLGALLAAAGVAPQARE